MKPAAPSDGPTQQHVLVFRLTKFPMDCGTFRQALEAADRDALERALRHENLTIGRRTALERRLAELRVKK